MNPLQRYLPSFALLLLIFSAASGHAQRFTSQSAPAMSPTTVQTTLSKRGIGKKVRIIEVDGSVVSGIINSIDEQTFQLTPKDAIRPAVIRYGQVAWVRHTGLSMAGKIAIASGAVGAGAIAYAFSPR